MDSTSNKAGGRKRWRALLAGLSAAVLLISVTSATSPADGAPRPARSADAFVDSIGVNTHVNYFNSVYGNYPLIKEKLTSLGIRHARDKAVIASAGYNETVYGRYKDLAASGVRFNLIVDPRHPNLQTVDGQKIAAIAEMAGNSLLSFEGPNEYNLTGNSDWATTLASYQRSLYGAVKGNASTAKTPVFGPALGRPYPTTAPPNLSASLDYGNLHNYPGPKPIPEITTYNVEQAKKMSGTKPLVATETGYHNALQSTDSHKPTSERAAGRYMPRLFLENFNRGIARTYSYELIDQFADADNNSRESNFGLVRNDGTEKPAYRSMKNLIGLLEDPGPAFTPRSLDYTLSGDTTNVRQVLLQKRDGRFYLVLWQETPSYDFANGRDISVAPRGVTLTLGLPARSAAAYLPAISAAATARYAAPKQLVGLSVPDHPLVVEITPSAAPPPPPPATTPAVRPEPPPAVNTRPTISQVSPSRGTRTRDRTPLVAARVTDKETDLSASRIRLVHNGVQKRNFKYDRTRNRLTYRPRAARGSHTIRIEARDAAGLVRVYAWRFYVR